MYENVGKPKLSADKKQNKLWGVKCFFRLKVTQVTNLKTFSK